MPAPDALDQSWGFTNPAAAKAAGIRVVSMYLSWDPSKNMTAQKVRAYHDVGIAVLFNWESQAGAPLKGAAQGAADATEAVRQAKAIQAGVGHTPKNTPAIYFSCDTDVNAGQLATIAGYYRAAKLVCNAHGFRVGVYGEADVVDYLASHGITQAEWQTLAWSGGRISTAADFYQCQINAKLGGADIDFDKVLHPWQLSAWWPPASTYDRPTPAPPTPQPIPAPVPQPNTPETPVPVKPVKPVNDLPTTGPLAVSFSNPDTGAKRTAAGWIVRIVQQLNRIGADVAAIRALLEKKG